MNKKRLLLLIILLVIGIIAFENKIFGWIANAWIIESDPIPNQIETIASTSSGTFPDRLTYGAKVHLDKAIEISHDHPEALIGYSAFTGSIDPTIEKKIKGKMLLGKRTVFVGYVSNTAAEAQAYHDKFVEVLGHEPKTVVLVTGEFHGRSVRFIYRRIFPYSRLIFVLTPWKDEIDPHDLQIFSRNKWWWLGANIARQAMIAWIPFDLGYWFYKKLDISQPTSALSYHGRAVSLFV